MAYSGGVKALLIAPSWVGDMVMAHTLVQRLAMQTQSLELHVAAPPATAILATRMAEVRSVHTLEFAHGDLALGRRRRVGRALAEENFARAYVLPNSWKSALVPYFARIPQRIGWHGESRYGLLNDRRRLDKAQFPLMIERFMALASDDNELTKPYPLPRLQVDEENQQRCLQALALTPERVTILCPGAEFGAAKKWPATHYAQVAQNLIRQGKQVWLMGSPKDVDDCAVIANAVPGVQNLAGHTALLDAVDLMSLAQQVICNDSGLMHVACALGVPTLGIFGSTSPSFTPPLGPDAKVVEDSLACRPCFQRTCPLGHLDCLRKLDPQRIIDQLAS